MDTVIATKGQIVIPKRLRDQRGLAGYEGKTIAIEDMDPLAALKVPR